MTELTLEERVAALEAEVSRLKMQQAAAPSLESLPWYEQVFGVFAGSEEFEEAARLGREYRESLRPPDYGCEEEVPLREAA